MKSWGCMIWVETGWAGMDAEPRPLWGTVNTMNNIYSERLVCIDRLWIVCAPYLFLPCSHEINRSWKELDEMSCKNFCTFWTLLYFSFLTPQKFRNYMHTCAHLHACSLNCLCPGDWCQIISAQNQQCDAGRKGRLAYCFPSLVKKKGTLSLPVCWIVWVKQQEKEGRQKRTHERRT